MYNKIQESVIFITIIISFHSCSSEKPNELLLKEINSGLIQSNAIFHIDAQNTIEAFKQKLVDPITKVKAELYYPKILRFQQATADLNNYIDTLKKILQKEAMEATDGGSVKNKSVNQLLVDNYRYKKLYKRLKQYKQKTIDIDSMRLERIKDYIVIISRNQDTINNDNFFKQGFSDATPLEAITYLNRLQNNVSIAEMKCMHFFNEQVSSHVEWLSSYQAILGQNAKILKAGDSLEIMGGVGSFTRDRLLQFSVSGKTVTPNEKGIAVYKFKTSKKLGPHSMPVNIRL